MAKRTGRIHYANIENSDRLRRVYSLLADGRWHGTRNIVRAADVCAVNSIITELRRNGFDIVSRCVGQGRYEYRMPAPGQRELFQ